MDYRVVAIADDLVWHLTVAALKQELRPFLTALQGANDKKHVQEMAVITNCGTDRSWYCLGKCFIAIRKTTHTPLAYPRDFQIYQAQMAYQQEGRLASCR
jgi:hypothetical protein